MVEVCRGLGLSSHSGRHDYLSQALGSVSRCYRTWVVNIAVARSLADNSLCGDSSLEILKSSLCSAGVINEQASSI